MKIATVAKLTRAAANTLSSAADLLEREGVAKAIDRYLDQVGGHVRLYLMGLEVEQQRLMLELEHQDVVDEELKQIKSKVVEDARATAKAWGGLVEAFSDFGQ